jgi:hypothetical protein
MKRIHRSLLGLLVGGLLGAVAGYFYVESGTLPKVAEDAMEQAFVRVFVAWPMICLVSAIVGAVVASFWQRSSRLLNVPSPVSTEESETKEGE